MLDPKLVCKLVGSHAEYLQYNYKLIDIFEGNLKPYVQKCLAEQLSPQSYAQAIHRLIPINLLPKIIDKLTNIYQTGVMREVIDGNENDKELLKWYEEKTHINSQMNCGNELFNLCKTTLVHPYVYEGVPQLRTILNDRFVVYSDDPVQPNKPTHVILLYGKKQGKDLYWVYTKDEFYIQDSEEKIDYEEMAKYGLDGTNPYGVLPFTYINESKYRIMPKQDTDTLAISVVLPSMITDLNLAAMFQCFSIYYGIDVDTENIKFAPNAMWFLKSDPETQTEPKLGTIKPEVDYDEVLNLIMTELQMYLNTKGIRASTVGNLTPDNAASGISKVIDEMDTFEARQKQVNYFQNGEADLWNLIANHMHPYWAANGLIENKSLFTPTAKIITNFTVQLPMQSRGQVVKDLKEEVASGFITRKKAIMRLNPNLTEDEINTLMSEIDEERGNGQAEEETQKTEVLTNDSQASEGESQGSEVA